MINWLSSLFSKKTDRIADQKSPFVTRIDIDELMRQGFALHENAQDSEAADIFREILSIDPFNADALYLLGLTLNKHGDRAAAIELIKKAIASREDEPFFQLALGDIYLGDMKFKDAAACYEAALIYDPSNVSALLNLAGCYETGRKFSEAVSNLEKILVLEPENIKAWIRLGKIAQDTGKHENAMKYFKKAHELEPDEPMWYSTYLFTINHTIVLSAKEIFEAHKKFDALYGVGKYGKITRGINRPNPARKLKVGYVSPDFRLHPVSVFFEPVLSHHNHNSFEIFCYHLYNKKDDTSHRLESKSDHWIECANLSDDNLCQKIEEDQIDILIDLAGHTALSRVLVFSRKPAPIQMTWLGYINTTGLSAIDYRIVDYYSDPIGVADQYHSEKLLRLPNSQWVFSKPNHNVKVSRLPALEKGYITFGSFNRFNKLSEKVLALWANVLVENPNSILLIVDVPDDDYQSIQRFFNAYGIEPQRLTLYGRMPYADFVALHQHVDIAFDAHPYSGATTTCESLWMGVPTLTLIGETSISRSTSSIIRTLELSDWIAHTEEEFIKIVKKQSDDLNTLEILRAQIREKMQSSPLMNAEMFTRNLEQAYRSVWQEKCIEQLGANTA